MHNITENDKQQGITQAWHGLTEIVPDLSLDNNWLAQWDIDQRPLFIHDGSEVGFGGEIRNINTGFNILVATDDPSITIGVPFNPNSYVPIRNAEFLRLMKGATEGIDGMKLVSVGSVRNRGRVFASFETQDLDTYVAGGRTFKPYLNFGNGHDKSSVLWTNTSNICTVCDNTFSMNLADVEKQITKSGARVRHTKNVVAKLDDLALVIRMANQAQVNFAMAFEAMADQKITDENAEKFLFGFVHNTDLSEKESKQLSTRVRNIVGRIMELFRNGKGNNGQNLADLFSGGTDFYTHENAGNGKNPMKQFTSSEFGSGADTKRRMFELLSEPVKVEDMIAKGAKLLEQSTEAK